MTNDTPGAADASWVLSPDEDQVSDEPCSHFHRRFQQNQAVRTPSFPPAQAVRRSSPPSRHLALRCLSDRGHPEGQPLKRGRYASDTLQASLTHRLTYTRASLAKEIDKLPFNFSVHTGLFLTNASPVGALPRGLGMLAAAHQAIVVVAEQRST